MYRFQLLYIIITFKQDHEVANADTLWEVIICDHSVYKYVLKHKI